MADTTTSTLSLGDIVGLVISSVKAVEEVYPAGSGKEKFDAVFAQIMAFAPLASVAAGIIEKLLPFMINTTVMVFNKVGTFLHPAATPAA